MKYFTPKLYIRSNSADESVADRADDEWEAAIAEYVRYLESVRGRVPSHILRLAKLYNHDARVLSRTEDNQPDLAGSPASWSAVGIVSLETDATVRTLFYNLWDHLRVSPFAGKWPFSKEAEHWMYDELDFGPDGRDRPIHRILLSSGVELEVPFTSVIVHEFALTRPPQKALA